MVELQTLEQEVGDSKPSSAVLCPRARHFTPREVRWLSGRASDSRARRRGGSKPTSAMLCPWARHFTPQKY